MRRAAWTMVGASLMTTLGSLPVFLLGAQSVLIRADLDFGAPELGLAVTAFFGTAATFALLGGRWADRFGRRAGTVTAGLLAAAGGFGISFGAHSWPVLLVLMAVLGAGNAACQVTSNLSVATAISPERRGLAFGVKQSAVPLSITIAGVSVPTLTAQFGWRATFTGVGLVGLVTIVLGLCQRRPVSGRAEAALVLDRPPMLPLLVVMAACALASASANSLSSFLSSWGFEVGFTPGQTGLLMAAGSGANVLMRVVSGYLADRRYGRNLPVAAVQMLVGGVALALLSVPAPATVVLAALAAFAVGWAWPGLLLYAVVRIGREAPATASSTVQAGAFLGSAVGPLAFGVVVDAAGYRPAWFAAAAAFLLAACLVVVARRLFIADLLARPPRVPLGYGGGRSAPARVTPSPES